jgi:protein SCO1
LSGDAAATAATAREFKVLYQKQPGSTPGSYSMDHSAGTFIFDPQGRLRLYVALGRGPDVYAHDIRELLRAAS